MMFTFSGVAHCYVVRVSNHVSVEIETDVLLNIKFNLISFTLQQSCSRKTNWKVCVFPVFTTILIALCKSPGRG